MLSKLLKTIKRYIPQRVKDYYNYLCHLWEYGDSHRRILREIRQHNHAKVAFVVMSLSMWKNQRLLELLSSDKRFSVKVILSPARSYSPSQQKAELEVMRDFFTKKGIPYEDISSDGTPYNLRLEFDPDVVFYQQSYEYVHCPEHDYTAFQDKLICYVPYSFWPGTESWGFDLPFHRFAWRIYYANTLLKKFAHAVSLNHARNATIVGYPSADLFLSNSYEDVWKDKSPNVKRIIWAPHFSINPETTIQVQSEFIMVSDLMLEIAQENQGILQIAFKPHPRLKSELYRYPGWGKERTDAYYDLWATMPNTQLETTEYVNLFMTSDALIHDCGSFIAEYQYARKPSLYITRDSKALYGRMNGLGRAALDCHYLAGDSGEIRRFIADVVINENDVLKNVRESFFERELLPPQTGSVAKNIYSDLLKRLNLR